MVKITARKYEGDDKYSWAVFRSDQREPVVTGLGRNEVPRYKRLVAEQLSVFLSRCGRKYELESDRDRHEGQCETCVDKNHE